MSISQETIQISKIAAAQRQLDAAIRMFFQREDELAIHTIAAAAFRILRDITQQRGKNFSRQLFSAGIFGIAKQYAAGTLSREARAGIEGG